ncbi:MAG: MOFRL family protein [Rhizobium sp.]|nr:MOFRL family protein [Rhizobium sp.]
MVRPEGLPNYGNRIGGTSRSAHRQYPAIIETVELDGRYPDADLTDVPTGSTVHPKDTSTPQDALAVIDRWKVDVPASVREALSHGSGVLRPEDPRLARTRNVIYAAPRQSLEAAAALAREAGSHVRLLGDALEGEAREVAAAQAKEALALQSGMKPGDPPILLLSGGELTVTRHGDGIGGPNAEFCLALALALDGAKGIHALACDTDGVDGAAEVAGALIGPDTLNTAVGRKVDPGLALDRNDAHSFCSSIGTQVVTGPMLTNVNDFRAIIIVPSFHNPA